LFLVFRDLEAFARKENAERKGETEDINEALRSENEKRIKEAQALKDKMERENKEMQVTVTTTITNNFISVFPHSMGFKRLYLGSPD
jgi:hypothetical protein